MTIEKQVCSLELAKRLKELGVKQDSLFAYINYKGMTCDGYELKQTAWKLEDQEYISAYTVAELGDLLPNTVSIPNADPFDNYRICITKFKSVDEESNITNNYIVNYECDSTEAAGEHAWLRRKLTNNIYDENLANAMAKILIYLIENGLVKYD